MTAAQQMTHAYAQELIAKVKERMTNFGDSYQKARAMIHPVSFASDKCWAIVDSHFNP